MPRGPATVADFAWWSVEVACSGRRSLLAVITRRATAEEVLRNMGLGSARLPLATNHSLPSLPWPSDRSRGYARRKRASARDDTRSPFNSSSALSRAGKRPCGKHELPSRLTP
jgi:hypothetical protein